MKNFYSVILVLIIPALYSQSPKLSWARTFGSGFYDNTSATITDNAGNVYSTGMFHQTVDFDPGPGTVTLSTTYQATNGFVTKFSPSGNLLWVKQFTGQFVNPTGMVIDGNGHLYISGYYNNTIDLDPGPGNYTMSPVGSTDIFICRLNNDGSFSWGGTIGSLAAEYPTELVNAPGGIYLAGITGESSFMSPNNLVDLDPGPGVVNFTGVGHEDVFFVKIDSTGGFAWGNLMGEWANDRISGMASDNAGNVYLAGNYYDTLDFDPGPAEHHFNVLPGVGYGFIAKYDGQGNFLWVEQIEGNGMTKDTRLAIDQNANVILTGQFGGSMDFDPSASASFSISSSSSWYDSFIMKLSSSGNFLWAKSFGSTGGWPIAITTDPANYIYVTGLYTNTFDCDPGQGTDSLRGKGTFVCKLDPSSNYKYGFTVEGNQMNRAYSIFEKSGYLYLSGAFQGKTDFAPGSDSLIVMGPNSETNAFIMKVCEGVDPPTSVLGNNWLCPGMSGSYSIAPVAGATSYSWIFPAGYTSSGTGTLVNATAGNTGGNISVSAVNYCNISAPASIPVSICTSLSNLQKPSLLVSPNPSDGLFTVSGEFPEATVLKIINALGDEVFSHTITPGQAIQTDLARGIYFFKIGDHQTIKVIIGK